MFVITHFLNINFINHVTTSLTTKLQSIKHFSWYTYVMFTEAQIQNTIRIRYRTDTSIRKNFKNQNTIRPGYVNKIK